MPAPPGSSRWGSVPRKMPDGRIGSLGDTVRARLAGLIAAILIACTPVARPPSAAQAPSAATAGSTLAPGDAGPVPIDEPSPRWGSDLAPVTLVEFSDLECPFCARVQPTLAALQTRYGPERLRIVWKHDPLPFHRNARPAALAAEAVRQLGGNAKFFSFIALVFERQAHLEPGELRRAAVSLGIDGASFDILSISPAVSARVDADVELAGHVGANGTPHFLINGARISGAVPLEDFTAVIDRELAEARALTEHGTPAALVYATRAKANFEPARDPKTALSDSALAEDGPWNVPVGTSPRLGPDDALVTIIEFSDFQCPYCKRVQPTLLSLRERYGNDLRIVWKHLPLPFHQRARPAATLAIEARKALGDAGFWKATDLLFDSSPALETADLRKIGGSLGLAFPKTERAIDADADADVLAEDEGTGVDFEVRGTPHFFINGNRLVGAQPLEAFTPIVDAELEKARKLVASGVPRARVFDELMRAAASPPPPEQKAVPAPTAENPSRGPANAPVTIQMFADFECPYCRRAMKTLDELEKRHPGQIRLVYRNLPLEFHTGARMAAAAALEAYAQRGADGFWQMAALLEADQDNRAPITRGDVIGHATALGLDVARLQKALDDGRHDATIDADVKLATQLDINGTPSFVVNGYYIPGAQPFAIFERAVQRALAARPAAVAR